MRPSRKSLIRNGMNAVWDAWTHCAFGFNSVVQAYAYCVRTAPSRTYTHYIVSQVSQWSNPCGHKGLRAGLLWDSFKVVSADGKGGPR
jgi:hypothetical protein